MNKVMWTIVCLVTLGIGLYSFYTKRVQEKQQEHFSTWQEFVPRSQLFKVLLPHTPQYGKDYIAIPNSDQKRRYDMYASEEIDGTLFLISVITYPPGIEMPTSDIVLRQNIDELIQNKVDSHLTKLVSHSFQTQNAWDFSFENKDFHVEGRCIQAGHIVYMLTYITALDHFDIKDFEYFVNSFQFLNKKKEAK